MTTFRFIGRAAACIEVLLFAASQAAGQSTQPVRLVVGYSAGGPVDAAARLFAPALAKELGTQVLVDNRPGASGVLAGSAVAKATPDGLTLFFAASPTITISPNVMKKMPFDPAKELTPIAPVLSYANVLVINKDLPFQNVAELVAYAKANPGKLAYGSAGVGASNHLSGELFAAQTKTQLNHVPYKGNAPAMTDVIGGQLAMMFDITSTARNFINAGRVRALAVTSRERNPSLAHVPTMREAGVPGYEVVGWYGVYGPARMPAALVSRTTEAVRKALASDELKALWTEQGYDPWPGGPEVLAAQAAKDREMWATVTKGIEIE
ncbi:Bug family tripartite tricarboxylate transporter substrate binding protein [Variovorax sp. RT4R15]|uniref:Bug family tripartite tricarboxylate transporter substrate binding protein n=1 Tax=Variovorax sp. RT4R15 TaxID=3443737 RepID=UPI003F45F071